MELLPPTRFLKYILANLCNPFQFLTLLFLRVMGAKRILLRQFTFLRSEIIAWILRGHRAVKYTPFNIEFVSLPGCCDASTAADGQALRFGCSAIRHSAVLFGLCAGGLGIRFPQEG